jgi:hypothetical protein
MALLEFLDGIGVDRETIRRISAMLEENRDLLNGSRPSNQTQGAFGGSPAGRDLDMQTLTAHQHVVEALEEMMAGLEGYAQNVVKFGDDMLGLDADVQTALMRGTREAETYSTSGDFHDNGIAPPSRGDEQGGGR